VSGWRDRATEQARDDLDGLARYAVSLAQQMLEESGEFYPFGATVDGADSLHLISGGPDLGDHPSSTQVLAALLGGMRGERPRLRAVAIASDVRLRRSDAIRVHLEHRDGHAVELYVPYRPKRFLRGYEFEDRAEQPGPRCVWGDDDPNW
jgi:hypothetical protein